MSIDPENPELTVDPEDDDQSANEVGESADQQDLNYNAEQNSFEYDVKGSDPDYDHPDPYDTIPKVGDDMDSTYDEANPYDTVDEYIPNASLETDADKLAMHIDDGKIVELDPIDEELSRTPEDDRDDLDEEGYPKNDQADDFLK